MIRIDLYGVASSFQFGSLDLESLDNPEEFLIIDLVIAFGVAHFRREVGYRAEQAVLIVLREYASSHLVRGVYFYNRRLVRVLVY